MYASPSVNSLSGNNILRNAPGCCKTSVKRVGCPSSASHTVPSHSRPQNDVDDRNRTNRVTGTLSCERRCRSSSSGPLLSHLADCLKRSCYAYQSARVKGKPLFP